VLACLVPLAGGCGRDADVRPGDIRSYAVPRGLESEPIAAAPRQSAAPAAGGERLRYEVPEGWSDRGASGMRLATLAIGDPADGREVTVINSLRAPTSRPGRRPWTRRSPRRNRSTSTAARPRW
jgi:hypothetical protein